MEPQWVPRARSLPERTGIQYRFLLRMRACKLLKIARQFRNDTKSKLIGDAEDARSHSAKSIIEFCANLELKAAPHPSYSLDLAPSDDFLFLYIKDMLKAFAFQSALHISRAIELIVHSVGRSTLIATFDDWISRAERYIQVSNWMY
jgi:hypothetical protein